MTADEGATCLVLLDVDIGYMKAVPAAGKTVTDYLIEGGRRFVEQFFRRRVRLRCDGEPTTLAYGARLKELLPESVVLERTPRHDSQANPAERAIRTLEEHVKVLRLDFEKRTGTELLPLVAVVDTSRGMVGCEISSEDKWSHATSRCTRQHVLI